MLPLLFNYPLPLHTRAYSPRANAFFLLTATIAHTYDAPAMTNSNTRIKEKERRGEKREEESGLDLRDWKQSRAGAALPVSYESYHD